MDTFFTIYGNPSEHPDFNFARFGFSLISVNKPVNEAEEFAIKQTAISWHENLFRSLSAEYRDSVQLNLKFITTDRKNVECYIIFTITSDKDDSLQNILKNVQHDLAPFFAANVDDNNTPYLFRKITNIDLLSGMNSVSQNHIHTLYFRKPVKIHKNSGIAFPSLGNELLTEQSREIPSEIFPPAVETIIDNELFRAMLNQNGYTEIDIELKPRSFTESELSLIRQIIKTPAILKFGEASQSELLNYTEQLRKFIAARHDKFIISLVLKTDNIQRDEFLKTSLQRYFFGKHSKIKTDIRKADLLHRFSSKQGGLNSLPFYYTSGNAIEIFRLPLPTLQDIPGIALQDFIFQQVPKNLGKDGILIGRKQTVNGKVDIRLSNHSLSRHLYIMGQTGTGKSTLLKTMIKDCIDKKYGFTVIDPHGDLFTDILKLIPENEIGKLNIINPTDLENPLGINPLNYDENNPQAKSLIINELMRAISSLYDMRVVGGPMFEIYLKNGLLLVMNESVRAKFGSLTLKDLCKLFYENEFRKALLTECDDQNVTSFFAMAHLTSGDQSFNNFAPYISSKLNRFVDDYYLEPLLTGKQETVDFRQLIENEKILLVRMDKGRLGADNTSLLGQIVLSNLFMAGMSRTDTDKELRKPYYIFIDEFQNFIRGDVGTALSEMRKYRINLVLANQTLGQLDNYLIESLLGNAGNFVFFRPGINDYVKIQHYFEPEFTRQDVLKLPNFNCIARLMMDNIPSDPFVFQTTFE